MLVVRMNNIIFLISFFLYMSVVSANSQDIFETVEQGKLEKVKKVTDKDPGALYIKDEAGMTPLHHSINNKDTQIMKFLIDENENLLKFYA